MNDDVARDHDGALSRRGALAKLGGFAAVALGAGTFGARELLDADDAEAAGAGPAAVASGLVTCVLAPEQTEGPYYVDDAAVRRNVTEGKPGVALTLRLTVVNASSCKPIKGAAVEIWHCDAGGVYSGVQLAGTEDECSCAASSARTRRAWRSSARSTPAGTRAAPSTSTRWCTSAGTSCTRVSSTSPTP